MTEVDFNFYNKYAFKRFVMVFPRIYDDGNASKVILSNLKVSVDINKYAIEPIGYYVTVGVETR
jgi:hypothetical protein